MPESAGQASEASGRPAEAESGGSMKKLNSFLTIFLVLVYPASGLAQWTQWGGPQRDFTAPSGALSLDWPESGPPELWSRELGDGFSSILYDLGTLYTMFRRGDQETVVAINAADGGSLWETSYVLPLDKEGMLLDFGGGPISTPLIVGNRLFTVGSMAVFHCLKKTTGEILWKRDLVQELGASYGQRGYAPSPLGFADLVILTVGGKDSSVVAFQQSTGEIVWKSLDLRGSSSSPILIQAAGQDQLIVSLSNHRAGLNPRSGEVEWTVELPRGASSLMATQHWNPEDSLLFSSSAYADGSRAFRIERSGGRFEAKELWYSRRMRVMFTSFVRIGDYVYGSSGGFGPVFLVCLKIRDGTIQWRQRGWGRTHFLRAGGQVLLMEEGGDLAVATATPESLDVHARANVMERICFTPPTLVGTRVYVRNRKSMKALDLGREY